MNGFAALKPHRDKNHRDAFSLIELLVTIAIIAIIVGLLLTAISAARQASLRMKDQNNLRQFALAVHNYASQNEGRFPRFPGVLEPTNQALLSVHVQLLPFLEQENAYMQYIGQSPGSGSLDVKCFKSPFERQEWRFDSQLTNYAINAVVFAEKNGLKSITDGLSNTILVGERIATCGSESFYYSAVTIFPINTEGFVLQRASFADKKRDYYPITIHESHSSLASDPTVTFQVNPTVSNCDPRLLNTGDSSGMSVALGDGSVRLLKPAIRPEVFWGMVTPIGGEVNIDSH